MRALAVLITVITIGLNLSHAQRNTVCSQSAKGISHCLGDKFVCNDGRISQSKKTCDPDTHGTKKQPQEKPKKSKAAKKKMP